MSELSPEDGRTRSEAILSRYGRQVAAQFGPGLMQRLRRLRLGIAALAGLPNAGWFIPYRHAQPARRPAYPALEPLFAAARPGMEALLGEMRRNAQALRAIPPDGPGLRWRQSWFPRLDGAAAYMLVRQLAPRRIIEIGSGHSTRFLARALKDTGTGGSIIAIDPSPRADLTVAMQFAPVTHRVQLLEDVDPALFGELAAGDILFIDSSHVAMPGSDVDVLVNDVLPRLPSGVHVHVHDVFLPDPYPEQWTWRGYNEQSVIGALIQGGAYSIVFSSRYAATRMAEAVAASVGSLPLVDGAFETSLWLRKV